MGREELAAALQRAEKVLQRRPDMGLHDDAPATARWQGGTRVVSSHANGTQMATDMPGELGGSGDKVSPGWLFRAGIASCAATTIAMTAATRGITLSTLEVSVHSRSDTRGLLGMSDGEGRVVGAHPSDLQLRVHIAATGVPPDQLHALVAESHRCAPIPGAVENALPIEVCVDISPG